jgi:YHS domain-containing protein
MQNSAADKQDSTTKTVELPKIPAVAISALASPEDPECGMRITEKEYADTALINGKIYGFCGTGCKEEYLKKPGGKK